MIVVTVREDGLWMEGHAEYAPKGQDIVCSAMSALVQSLIKGLTDLDGGDAECFVEEGFAKIHWRSLSDGGKLLVDSFFLAVCQITKDYPENVKIA